MVRGRMDSERAAFEKVLARKRIEAAAKARAKQSALEKEEEERILRKEAEEERALARAEAARVEAQRLREVTPQAHV